MLDSAVGAKGSRRVEGRWDSVNGGYVSRDVGKAAEEDVASRRGTLAARLKRSVKGRIQLVQPGMIYRRRGSQTALGRRW